MVTVQGPPSVARAGGGPVFSVPDAGGRFLALEVATDPALLAPAARPGGGPLPGFHGSWLDGPLSPGPVLRLPGPVWAELRSAPALWYRVMTSEIPGGWVGVTGSVPDDRVAEAPSLAVVDVETRAGELPPERLDTVWGAATRDDGFAAISRREGAGGAVVRHVDRAGRPRSPGDVSWLVLVSAPAAGGVEEMVARLREPDLVLESVQATAAPEQAVGPSDVMAVGTGDGGLTDAMAARPDLLERLGPVWVWQDLGPPPVEGVGGTVLVSGRTGRLVFAEPARWAPRAPRDP